MLLKPYRDSFQSRGISFNKRWPSSGSMRLRFGPRCSSSRRYWDRLPQRNAGPQGHGWAPTPEKTGKTLDMFGSLRIQICPWITGFPLYSDYSGDGIETINPTLGKGLDSLGVVGLLSTWTFFALEWISPRLQEWKDRDLCWNICWWAYCWWFRNPAITSWYGEYSNISLFYKVLYMPIGAGFLSINSMNHHFVASC